MIDHRPLTGHQPKLQETMDTEQVRCVVCLCTCTTPLMLPQNYRPTAWRQRRVCVSRLPVDSVSSTLASIRQGGVALQRPPTDSVGLSTLSCVVLSGLICGRPLRRQSHGTFGDLCSTANDELFNIIVTNPNHILHTLLPPHASTASQHYTWRRTHPLQLLGHATHLSDCNFILRILYKNCHWH